MYKVYTVMLLWYIPILLIPEYPTYITALNGGYHFLTQWQFHHSFCRKNPRRSDCSSSSFSGVGRCIATAPSSETATGGIPWTAPWLEKTWEVKNLKELTRVCPGSGSLCSTKLCKHWNSPGPGSLCSTKVCKLFKHREFQAEAEPHRTFLACKVTRSLFASVPTPPGNALKVESHGCHSSWSPIFEWLTVWEL